MTDKIPTSDILKELEVELLNNVTQGLLNKLPEPFRTRAIEATDFRMMLISESDRGCALMAAAFLDDQLSLLIKEFLVQDQKVVSPLFESNGPIATFSSRISLSYALGLIPYNAYRELNLLRKIRNEFAHISQKLSFESPAIAARCRELSFDGFSIKVAPRKKFVRSMLGILVFVHDARSKVQSCQPLENHDESILSKAHNEVKDFFNNMGWESNPFANPNNEQKNS